MQFTDEHADMLERLFHAFVGNVHSDPHVLRILLEIKHTMSALSDATDLIKADLATLGTAITDVQTRVAALSVPSDAADVAAAVSALGQAHTDIQTAVTNLAAIPAAPTA